MRRSGEGEIISVGNRSIRIPYPDKLLWPETGLTMLGYLRYLADVSPHMLAYTRDRMAMLWRYPGGVNGPRIEERSIHQPAPEWLPRTVHGGKERLLLNDPAALLWAAADREACELHVPFDRYTRKDIPTELAFDLDPPEGGGFPAAAEAALALKPVLDDMGLRSFAKTSGASGLHVFVPVEPKYPYEDTRRLCAFVARYMLDRMPGKLTTERLVNRREGRLYFDYLQLWRGRTLAAPYSVRAKPLATVSTPVTWDELERGVEPGAFTVHTVPERLRAGGDPFAAVSGGADGKGRLNQPLDAVMRFILSQG